MRIYLAKRRTEKILRSFVPVILSIHTRTAVVVKDHNGNLHLFSKTRISEKTAENLIKYGKDLNLGDYHIVFTS